MDYEAFFSERLDALRAEGRYRVFADLERRCGRFPRAFDHRVGCEVTDPGRALITGMCADIGKVKGPILRGLAARAPYFHNGSATTLADVVEFYDQRFDLDLTEQQKADLVAFLSAL